MVEPLSFSYLWQSGRSTVEYIIDSMAWLTWLTKSTSLFDPGVSHARGYSGYLLL